MHPQLHDAAWLAARYTNDGATLAEIAAEIGANKGSVSRALARHNIPTRPSSGRPVQYPQLADREWLTRRYVSERASTVKIAAEVGCVPSAVAAALARHDIPTRPPSGRPVEYPQLHDRSWLTRRYLTGEATVAEIAAEVGCTPELVYYMLRRHGLQVRRRQPAGRAT